MGLGNIFIGTMFIAFGIFVIYKAYYIQHQLLPMGWFERKFGPGTGTFAYKILGLIFIIFGVLTTFGVIDTYQAVFGGMNLESTPNPNQIPEVPKNQITD